MGKSRQLVLLSRAPDLTILVPYALYPSRHCSQLLYPAGNSDTTEMPSARQPNRLEEHHQIRTTGSYASPYLTHPRLMATSLTALYGDLGQSQAGRSHMQGVSSQSGKALVLPQTTHLHTSCLSGPFDSISISFFTSISLFTSISCIITFSVFLSFCVASIDTTELQYAFPPRSSPTRR